MPLTRCEGATHTDVRPVIGTLKGYDQLMNLVLDEVKEALTGMSVLFYLAWEMVLMSRRRRRQYPLPQTRPHCCTRHTTRRHLACGRKRGDCEPLHTRGRVRPLIGDIWGPRNAAARLRLHSDSGTPADSSWRGGKTLVEHDTHDFIRKKTTKNYMKVPQSDPITDTID